MHSQRNDYREAGPRLSSGGWSNGAGTKPHGCARRKLLRQTASRSVVIDRATWEVWIEGQPVGLTPTEGRILAELVRQPDEVFPGMLLACALWPDERLTPAKAERRLYPHVSRLRQKLPRCWGFSFERLRQRGYVLRPKPGRFAI